jgi:hypothetical protein
LRVGQKDSWTAGGCRVHWRCDDKVRAEVKQLVQESIFI